MPTAALARASALLCVCALVIGAAAQLELVQVQVLTRHGDRTPTGAIPTWPVTWTCSANSVSMPEAAPSATVAVPARLHSLLYISGLEVLEGNCSAGQLTDIGQVQQQALGQAVAIRYMEDYSFLPAAYSSASVYVRTSETPRCVMSAQEFLGGLYPPPAAGSAVPVAPIYTIDSQVDSMQLNPSLCPAMDEALLDLLLNNKTFIERIAEYLAPVTPAICKAFNTTDPLVGLRYYDNLVCMQAHGLPLPTGITPVVFQLMSDAYNQIGTAVFAAGAFSMGPFFATLLLNMDAVVAAEGMVEPRFMLFSGHDTSVGPTLSALGVYPGLWPPYAAHIFFELYQNRTDSDGWFVQTLYQGLPVVPRGCPSNMCPLAVFQALLAESIPDDYSEACKITAPRAPVEADESSPLDLVSLRQLLRQVVRLG